MRLALCIHLCLLAHFSFSQNYVDSALALYQQINLDSLPESEQKVLEAKRSYFTEAASDSLIFEGLSGIVGESDDAAVEEPFNELYGRMADWAYQQAKTDKKRRLFKSKKASYYSNKAISCFDRGNYPCAYENIYEAIGVWESITDTAKFLEAYLMVSSWHMSDGAFEKVDSILHRTQILAEATRDSANISNVLFYTGVSKQVRGDHQQSLPSLLEALPWMMREAHPIQKINILERIAQAYTRMQQYEKASAYFENCLARAQEFDDFRLLSSLYITGGDLYYGKKDWKRAEEFGLLGMELTNTHNSPYLKAQSTNLLHRIYRKQGRYQEALDMYSQTVRIRDSLSSEANRNALLDKEYSFKYQKQLALDSLRFAAQIDLEKAAKKQRTTISWFLLGGLVLIAVFFFILWNRFKLTQQQKSQLDRANEELKALDETKSRFFTNISHEFKTPLTVISGIADMIEQPEQRELIGRNSKNLLNLVNQILDLRKLEANKLAFDMQQGDIVPYLKYLLESFESYAESKFIDLKFDTEVEELIMNFDSDKINSIVTNLISNAIKFTPERGEVGLSVRASDSLKEKGESNLSDLLIKVSDTGIGIPAEKLPHIFDRFYQVDDSSTRANEGTGIGLTFTHDLVVALGGEISVESEMNKGTVFTVSLPVKREAPIREQIPTSSERKMELTPTVTLDEQGLIEGERAPFRLLIVEDNEDVMQYLRVCLAPSYQLLLARDGQEGIEMAIEHVPDIIISDVMMPRKDGFELCQTLKEDDRTSHIPIVLLTAKSDVESRISGLSRGADAYLPKPFEKRELMIRLENLIRIRQRLQVRYQRGALPTPSEDEAVQKEDAFVQKVRALILEHLDDPELNVAKLSDMAALSRAQLHNKMKALTGLSSSRFLRQVRLREAQKLLAEGDLQMAEIAYRCGFSSPAYFSRMFVDEFGKTPTAFKNG